MSDNYYDFPNAGEGGLVPPLDEYAPLPKRPAWPTAIGVISVVLGSLGFICTPIVMAAGARNTRGNQVYELFPDWYHSYTMAAFAVGLAIAVVLLLAGIYLLKRRPAAKLLHVTYALIQVFTAVVNAILLVTTFLPSIRQSSAPEHLKTSIIIGWVIGIPIGLVYPVFLLIWFCRPKIVQQVRQWSASAAPQTFQS